MFEVAKLYARWCKNWGTWPVRSWLQASQAYRDGNFEKAERLYHKGLARYATHPANFSARLDLAYCMFKQRKLVEAEEVLRFVTAHSPKSREAHLRLARLQMWMGQTLDAAWTIRRALRELPGADAELASIFLLAVLETGGPAYLLEEAERIVEAMNESQRRYPLLEVARARLAIFRNHREEGKDSLLEMSKRPQAPFEAVLALGELYLSEGKIQIARTELSRAMTVSPEHPRVLTLMSECYLSESPFYNPDYARQLATSACQNTAWCSPREMHILAQAYLRCGDKMSALIIASKAKQAGSRLMGEYTCVKNLDKLIETLSSGTQA